jgi:hypothetical protein
MVTNKAARIPKLEFRHSWVYDQENKLRFTDPLYPSGDDIRGYIAEVSKSWKPRHRTFLNSISRVSGLPWREDYIVCYVVGRCIPISDPLTIPIYEKRTDTFMEKLIYQLIERLLMHPRNLETKSGFWESMFRSLSEEGVKVSYMIPVNAIFRDLSSRHFKGNDAGKSLLATNLDYKRAWEIVDKMGHETIIEKFRRGEWDL